MHDAELSPFRRANAAASPRTLVDILRATADQWPDAPALDTGSSVLTYAELIEAAEEVAADLAALGVGPGDRVGVRLPSGMTELYVAIVGVLLAGAAYVPVDVDDPDARARTVFAEAEVAAVLGDVGPVSVGVPRTPRTPMNPTLTDDAWVIFTSGSTGKPKGVAVSHRSAAAFVDAEPELFCRDVPLGPADRVMAGLSVAFDASCEEMWLAWRYGGCLVPAPRSLVKSGTDLGPWLIANRVTVVSTVPTLVSLWPADALAGVRLVILGGEACAPDLADRLIAPGREVWNTYGPTEATVVACAALLESGQPVRIGLPLAGWDLAVVGPDGVEVEPGATGELIIGGVGLARYLDPDLDAERFAPHEQLGWSRAYRSGDLVINDVEGLRFVGRADAQIKIGGRRIELGEIDDALLALPGVVAAATAVRTSAAGNRLLVGYLQVDASFDAAAARASLRAALPGPMVPRLALVDDVPTRTSGKVDRDALPWPLPTDQPGNGAAPALTGTAAWIAEIWAEVLGATPGQHDQDFFDLGGGSLPAAQVVARLREQVPEVTVGDLYEHPTLGALASFVDSARQAAADRRGPGTADPAGRHRAGPARVDPVSRATGWAQLGLLVLVRGVGALRWTAWVAMGVLLARPLLDWAWLPEVPWVPMVLLWLVVATPPGRVVLAAAAARLLLRSIRPGRYVRGGAVHRRVWLAERLSDELGATGLSAAGLIRLYARCLGCHVGPGVDLHAVPPVTGLLSLGAGCSIEPEVDLSGVWVDGGWFQVGAVRVGERARVGARSTLVGGAQVGDDAEIGPGSAVLDVVPAGEYWSGSPARSVGRTRGPLADEVPPRHRGWMLAYALTGPALAALPAVAYVVAAIPMLLLWQPSSVTDLVVAAFVSLPLVVVAATAVLAALIIAVVRAAAVGLEPGLHPVHGRIAWQVWTTVRVLDEARSWLFGLYSSRLTPWWLRRLGARIGDEVEASTVLLVPSLTRVGDGAFLADDTMLGMYELGSGWLRVDRVKIGRRAFVGNSGMTAPGRKVPRGGLVAVLSAAPRRADARSGTSWLGSPPTELRRVPDTDGAEHTFAPSPALRRARGGLEAWRIGIVMVHAAIGLGVVTAILLAARSSWWSAAVLALVALLAAGAVALAFTVVLGRALVAPQAASEHPLWSHFVWRNELADTAVEVVGAPWFARHVVGSPLLPLWLRALGASVGRGVWCETYWVPEPSLVTIGDGATINRGCVVQTHLFHDRILRMDTVELEAGATLGPHGVVLPAARLARHSTVGPASLVMRGEMVPPSTRWMGNPIGPWIEESTTGGPA